MKKRIISLVLALSFVFASVMSANAASFSQNGAAKTPTAITYKDITRLQDLASSTRGKQAKIVNAVRYNGSNTTWVVRLNFGEAGDQCAADFVITTYPYGRNPKTQEINTLPFGNVEEGTAYFGPCWYFFGVFDDVTHNSCGFCVAERIKRWPDWKDLSFSGVTARGVGYTGSYPQTCDEFVADHQ